VSIQFNKESHFLKVKGHNCHYDLPCVYRTGTIQLRYICTLTNIEFFNDRLSRLSVSLSSEATSQAIIFEIRFPKEKLEKKNPGFNIDRELGTLSKSDVFHKTIKIYHLSHFLRLPERGSKFNI
jgi:hypothetical protein